jgi:hypothetical protein
MTIQRTAPKKEIFIVFMVRCGCDVGTADDCRCRRKSRYYFLELDDENKEFSVGWLAGESRRWNIASETKDGAEQGETDTFTVVVEVVLLLMRRVGCVDVLLWWHQEIFYFLGPEGEKPFLWETGQTPRRYNFETV